MFEKCPNCLKRVIKGSKYCTHCGEKMPQIAKTKRRKVNKGFNNRGFTNSKKLFSRYQSYFVERIKEPTVSMKKSMNKESFRFGLAQLIVLIMINSFTVLSLSGKAHKVHIEMSPELNVPMLALFVGVIILQVFYILNTVLSLYVATNYLKKVPTTVQTIISRLGGLASPQLILSVILFFATALKIGLLSYIALILLVLINLTNMSFYLFSIKNNSKIPNFYIAIFALAFLLILQVATYSLIMRFSTNPQIYPAILRTLMQI